MGGTGVPLNLRTARRFERFVRKPVRVPPKGSPRSEITVPISPSGVLSDAVAYEQPADANSKLHLPRFRIRTDGTTYDIHVAPVAGRWSIRFGIEPYPAEELGDAARTPALPFTLPTATLAYHAPPLDKQLAASEIIPDDGGWTIGFDMDLPGKDEVLWALASEHGIKLVVDRSFTAAVPVVMEQIAPIGHVKFVDNQFLLRTVAVKVQDPEPDPVPLEPVPDVVDPVRFKDKRFRVGFPGLGGIRVRDHRLGVGIPVAREHRIEAVGRIRPEVRDHRVKPDQPVVSDRRSAIPTTSFTRLLDVPFIGVTAGAAKPVAPKQRLELISRFRDVAFDPGLVLVPEHPTVGVPPEIGYRETATVLPSEAKLRLEPAAHPAIFSGGATTAPSLRAVRVIHPPGAAGRSHVYFQDENRPGTFHYLPDEYRLDRTDAVPLRPAVVFRVEQDEEDAEVEAAMTFRLAPRVDHDRLEAAVPELRKLLPPPREGEPTPEVTLVPVQAEAELNLGLPSGAELEAPPLDLVNGFVAQVFFPFDKFQDVFAALSSQQEVATLLRGNVDVEIGSDEGHALIPVDIRFGSASSAVLTAEDSVVAGGGMALTLRNSSESPVRIDALPLRMARGDAEVPATAAGLVLPLELAAGAETSFEVTASEPLPGDGEAEVLVDLAAVVPLPDPEAILALTLDQQIAQMSEREVTVVIPRTRLTADDPLHTIFVEFAGSDEVVQVDAENMQVKAGVPVPLVDVLLRRDSAPYRFRQTVLRDSGEQRDAEWRTSDAGILVVPVV